MCNFSTAVYFLRHLFHQIQHRKQYSRRLEMQIKVHSIYWVCVALSVRRSVGNLCRENLHGLKLRLFLLPM